MKTKQTTTTVKRLRLALDMAGRMQADQDAQVGKLRYQLAESVRQCNALATFAQIAFDRLPPEKRASVLLCCAKWAVREECPF